MSLLAAKTLLRKTWAWLRTHWQIPFIIIWSIVVWVISRRNTDAIMEAFKARKDSYKQQLEVITRTHRDEILKRENLIKEYDEALKAIEKAYEEKKQEITILHKEKVKDVIIKSRKNPEEIISKIEKEFGIKYVK